MKRKYMTALILMLAMFLTACQPDAVGTIPRDTATSVQDSTEPRNTIHPDGPVITDTNGTLYTKVEEFQKLLSRQENDDGSWQDRTWYMDALNGEYRTTSEMDLACLFYNGFPDESGEPTQAEIEYLNSTGRLGAEWECMDFFRLPVEKMDAVLQQYFSITFEKANKESLDELVYWEETNCYYAFHNDARGHVPVVTEVTEYVRNWNRQISVRYYDQNSLEQFVLTVGKKDSGDYYVVSNLAVLDGDKAETMKKTLNDEFSVFNQRLYSYVLGAKFVSPEWVDLGELFSDGIPGNGDELTDHEKEVLVKMGFNLNYDTVRLSADDMNAVLKEYLGIGLDQVEVNGFRNMVYLESTECWYRSAVFNRCVEFEASEIKTDGKDYYVVSYVAEGRKGETEIREKDDGGYYILSNRYESYFPELEKG